MKNKFIYFPSVSAGAFGGYATKNNGISQHGINMRYYDKEFYGDDSYPYILLTAGHLYKDMNAKEKFGIKDDTLIMGDSGGFQIATGAIEYSEEIVDKILKWQEKNVDIGINLDIPTRGTYKGKFKEALEISLRNFRYFEENRSNSDMKLLNVLQGDSRESCLNWYENVKDFNFDGWSVGGIASLNVVIHKLLVLFQTGKIYQNEKNKYLHFLGTSKISDIVLFTYIQKKLQELGSNLIITCDSSSPSLHAVFGRMSFDFDINSLVMRSFKLPSYKTELDLLESMIEKNTKFINNTRLTNYFNDLFDYSSIKECYESEEYQAGEIVAITVMYNLGIYIEAVEMIKKVIESGEYIYEQILPKKITILFKLIDDIFGGMSYDKIMSKYYYHIESYDKNFKEEEENDFWE